MHILRKSVAVLAFAGFLLPLLPAGPARAAQPQSPTAPETAEDLKSMRTAQEKVEREIAGLETAVTDLLEYSKSYASAADIRRLAAEREAQYALIRARQASTGNAQKNLHALLYRAELRQSALLLSEIASLRKYPSKRRWETAREASRGSFGRESEWIISEGFDARERQRKNDVRVLEIVRRLRDEKTEFERVERAQESAKRLRTYLLAVAGSAALAGGLILWWRRRAA